MEISQLQRIKALLPVEVTAAFIAIQSIVNGEKNPVGIYQGANSHQELMLFLIVLLILANVFLLYRGGMKGKFAIAFSTIGFIVWAANLDRVRWEDWFSYVGFTPDIAVIILPICAIVYSLFAGIVSTGDQTMGG